MSCRISCFNCICNSPTVTPIALSVHASIISWNQGKLYLAIDYAECGGVGDVLNSRGLDWEIWKSKSQLNGRLSRAASSTWGENWRSEPTDLLRPQISDIQCYKTWLGPSVLSINTLHPFHLDLVTNFFFAKMVLPVPELGDFITFPAAPTNSVTIGWYQTKWTWREEEYYCAPCFTRGKDTTDFDVGCKYHDLSVLCSSKVRWVFLQNSA